MECEFNPCKLHYNIGMSKRTRKPLNPIKEAHEIPIEICSLERESTRNGVDEAEEKACDEGEDSNSDRKSLKQLIKERSSLGQHFTEEENQLQLQVVKQHDEGLDKVKFKRLVSRYAKVLSRLIKVKRDPHLGSQKKPVLRFTM